MIANNIKILDKIKCKDDNQIINYMPVFKALVKDNINLVKINLT